MKKLKICKCGHDREDHKKGLVWNAECNVCRCFSYQNRTNNKENLAFILVYSGIMGVGIFLILNLYAGIPKDLAEKTISITIGSLILIISGVIEITLVFIACSILLPKITEYKRKIYPIQDTQKNENP